jgi:HEAT repeat protein
MELRWRAVTAAGRLGGRESVPELERAIKRNEWYLRSAALVALQAADRNEAIKWSKKLLSDKALVVRSSAVTALVDLNDVSSTQLLWQKLYAKENFKGSQSLFIRRRIIEALTKLAQPGSEGKFVEALADKDTALHGPAIAALERLTQEHLGSATEPLNFKREHWQKWWKMRAQAKATHATATL